MALSPRRCTIVDPEAFPCQQCYVQEGVGVFWDLLYLHHIMSTDKPLRFVKQVHKDASGLVDEGCIAPPQTMDLDRIRHCSTVGLLAFFFVTLRDCRKPETEQMIRNWLTHLCRRACAGLVGATEILPEVILSPSGIVTGFLK